MKNGGGHFAPELGGHFELESGGHFKLELGGQYHWNLQPNGQYVEECISEYNPKYFYPPLKTIDISKKVTEKVTEQLNLSFSHFFNDLLTLRKKAHFK